MKSNFGKKKSRGQVSAELIILIGVVLSIALVLVAQLKGTANDGKEKIVNNSGKVFAEIDAIGGMTGKVAEGGECNSGSECEPGTFCDFSNGKPGTCTKP